jgi:hypothetical protein
MVAVWGLHVMQDLPSLYAGVVGLDDVVHGSWCRRGVYIYAWALHMCTYWPCLVYHVPRRQSCQVPQAL